VLGIHIFSEATPCRWASDYRRFEETGPFILNVQAVLWLFERWRSVEMPVTTHQTTQHHIPWELNIQKHRCENLKSQMFGLNRKFTYFIKCKPQTSGLQILYYHIPRPIRRTFFPRKSDLNSTCVLCAEGKYYFQTYKYPYIYYTISLSWDSENNHENSENNHEKMILVALTTIFWVSMMNKLYYVCKFWYVTILFSSNNLLKLKYIHHFF
jgi:hypothetical protein